MRAGCPLTTAAIVLACVGQIAAQEIALENPGFEQAAENDPTMPAGWLRWQAGPEQIYLDEQNPFEGERCAAVKTNKPGGGTVVLKQFFSGYEPGQMYEVVLAGRTNGIAGGRAQVISKTALDEHRGRAGIYPGELLRFENTDWQQLAFTFTGPKQPGETLYLELSHLRGSTQGGITWYDDISIRPLTQEHVDLRDKTQKADAELYAALVETRYEIGKRCDMLGYFAEDAGQAGVLAADAAAQSADQAQAIFEETEALVASWHERHEQVYGANLAYTRLSAEEMAARARLLAETATAGKAELATAAERWYARLAELEAAAREAAGDFTVEPQVSAEVTPDTLADRFHRIVSWHGFMEDENYVRRAMWDLGVTIVQGYFYREERWPLKERFFAANRPRTLAYLDSRHVEGWPDIAPAKEDFARELALAPQRPGFVGIQVDEPSISDKHVTTDEGYAAFREYVKAKYAEAEREALGLAGLDGWTLPEKVETDAERAAWMEFQQFKIALMTERLKELQDFVKAQAQGMELLAIIQQFVPSEPQRASYPAVSAALDWIAMDPYNGGNLGEAFLMDLLRSNSKGPTSLVVGTCYDPTADRFHKDMCISLGHADGLYLWCWLYMNKYRAPNFWGRRWDLEYRDRWKRGMWEAAREVFASIQAAEPYLVKTRSAAPVALVYSERTGIVDSREHFGYYANNLGLYQALQQSHVAQEAVFAESLTKERLARRKVLLLADARCLSDAEVELIRRWVSEGGSLVAIGSTSLCDAWGREREDYALADVFGASYRERLDEVDKLLPGDRLKELVPGLPDEIACWQGGADVVEPTTATVLATLPDGQPAVLENDFGSGKCFLITPRCLPMSFDGSKGTKGLYKYYWPGVRELLAGLTWAALDAAGGSQPVLAENCPPDTELVLRRQGDRVIVHLLNYHDEGHIKGVRLRVAATERKRVFYADNPKALLKCPPAPGGFTIPVSAFDHHVMLVIEPA